MSERAWKVDEFERPQPPPYVIRVNALWRQDASADLQITCTCGQRMELGEDIDGSTAGESILAEELFHLVGMHAATHEPSDLLRVSPSAVG